MLSLFRVLIDCDVDETVLFELMITCTGLWLTCFVILFLYTRLLSFPRLLSPGLLLRFEKVICNFMPQWRQALTFNWVSFWRLQLGVLFVCGLLVPFFNWVLCDEMVPFNLMITCTGLWLICFCATLFVYMTVQFSLLLSTGWLLSLSGRVIRNFVPQGRQALAIDWVSFWGLQNGGFLFMASLPFLNDCFLMKLCPLNW